MAYPSLRSLAVPTVSFITIFLAISSQYLFYHLEPGHLKGRDFWLFNGVIAATCWSYERVCRADPGRLPKALKEEEEYVQASGHGDGKKVKRRWCKKCEAIKPPRAHHCRQCGRCIPKMDHHCPWTANCISHTTFPHFYRFVLYTTLGLSLLDYHLAVRGYAIYEQRNLPAYLGPSLKALSLLLVLLLVTNIILLSVFILLVSATKSLLVNTTMIELWEIERHDALVEKARYRGGFVYGPGGVKVRIQKQEFPYDVGIWRNLVQGMGTRNVLAWILPFGGAPTSESGWEFPVNGFEDEGATWPPVDPEKMPRPPPRREDSANAFIHENGDAAVVAFRKRQEDDYKRRGIATGAEIRQREIERSSKLINDEEEIDAEPAEENEEDEEDEEDEEYESEYEEGMDGKEGWMSSDGSRLRDFGVDEDEDEEENGDENESTEIIADDDDIPLGELRRRLVARQRG